MKLIKNKYTEKFFGLSTLLLFSFPVLPFAAKSIAVGVWVFACLLLLVTQKERIRIGKSDGLKLIITSIPFILLLFSLLYSDNEKRGVDLIFRMSLLLIIPWLYFLNRKHLSTKLFQTAKWIVV